MKPLIINSRLFILEAGFLTANGAVSQPGGPESITADPFKLGNSKARFIMQRKAGTYNDTIAGQAGTYDPIIAYGFEGSPPASVQARAVDFTTGAEVKGWTTLTGNTISGQQGQGRLPGVPSGCDYRLQIRDPSRPTVIYSGTVMWGVGVVGGSFGQSNNLGILAAGSYNDAVPGVGKSEYDYIIDIRASHGFYGTYGPVVPQGLGGSGADYGTHQFNLARGGAIKFPRVLSKALEAKHGRRIPVALIPCAVDGRAIEDFILPDGGLVKALFNNSGMSGGSFGLRSPNMGDFEFVQKHQGEANNGNERAVYAAKERQMVDGYLEHVSSHGRAPGQFNYIPGVLGVYSGLSLIEKIRSATLDVVAYSKANAWANVVPFNCIDLDPSDGGDANLHFLDQPNGGPRYQEWGLCRAIQSVLFSMGLAPFDGMGPKVTTYTRAGNVVTFEVLGAQGALVARKPGEPITGWYANTQADFKGAATAVSVAIVGNKIVLTFPAGTFDNGKKAYVKHCGGDPGTQQSCHPDVSNLVYDSAQYPSAEPKFTGLPFWPIPDALEVV